MFILVRGFRTYSHVRRHRKVSILGMVLPRFNRVYYSILYGWWLTFLYWMSGHIPYTMLWPRHGTYDFSFSVVVMCFLLPAGYCLGSVGAAGNSTRDREWSGVSHCWRVGHGQWGRDAFVKTLPFLTVRLTTPFLLIGKLIKAPSVWEVWES